MVGSRNAEAEDLAYSALLGSMAAQHDYSIVSGGARGVDEAAMFGALLSGGKAIGVIADGLMSARLSEKYRDHLMDDSLVLISPYSPEARFNAGNAMRRNKFIYCLSSAAFVVHSDKGKGGTWRGALENLKGRWVRLWVRENSDPATGNIYLEKQGATRVPRQIDELNFLDLFAKDDTQKPENESKKTEMSKPKRNHFVPRMLLRNFTNQKGLLHFFDKRFTEKRIRQTTPDNFCLECGLYMYDDEHGNKNISIESDLAELEGKAAKVIEKIIEATRTEKLPELTCSEKGILDRFFYCQWARTPDMVDQILGLREKKTKRELSELKEEIGTEYLFADLLNPPEHRLQILGNKGLVVKIIRNSEKSFIIGSCPVLRSVHGIPLYDPRVELCLPIASDIAVILGLSRGSEKLVEIEDAAVRTINEEILRQSSAIGGCSDELIASLAGVKQES